MCWVEGRAKKQPYFLDSDTTFANNYATFWTFMIDLAAYVAGDSFLKARPTTMNIIG